MTEWGTVLMQAVPWVAIALLGAALGALIMHLYHQKTLTALRTRLEMERQAATEQGSALEKTFFSLASQALKHNNQTFLQLAQENLKQFHIRAQSELEKKEKSVENMVLPIREALDKTEQQIRLMEQERKQAYGSLHKHLETLSLTQQRLHDETQNLVQALRRPEVRGQWGEMTLKRLVELAGMVQHCDFFEQEHSQTETGAIRPDMIVRLPGGREIVVDVKTPLDAYLSAVEQKDPEEQKKALQHHARKVRERVRELAAKAYWQQFDKSPDFVVLFIPGEQFLSAALDYDRELLEYALQQKIILATPTSLIALLRAIAYGWRQEQLTANAETIRVVGEDLYKRLSTFSEHLARLGRSLDGAVGHFNKAVGSFDSKVLPGARKFVEMGVSSDKTPEEIEQIEKGVRELGNQSKIH